MLPEIEKLLVIQNRDQKIAAIKHELKIAPLEKKALEENLAAASKRVDECKAAIQANEVARKKLELDIGVRESQIEKFKLQQSQTKRNEEYQALANEVVRYTADIGKLEDAELELMVENDQLQADLKAAQDAFDKDSTRIKSQIADLDGKVEALNGEVVGLEAESAELGKAIDEDVLSVYQRLLKSKGDAAVVALEHEVCTGCHMKLTTQTTVQVKAEKGIVQCESCGRILYPEE